MMEMILKVAAKALIVSNSGVVLLLREAETNVDGTNAKRYHLPGGRLNAGEAFYDGLAREVLEETGLTVVPLYPLYVGEWRPVIRDVPHQIICMFLACKPNDTEVALSEEHDEVLWINPVDHSKYDIMHPEHEVFEAYLTLQNLTT